MWRCVRRRRRVDAFIRPRWRQAGNPTARRAEDAIQPGYYAASSAIPTGNRIEAVTFLKDEG